MRWIGEIKDKSLVGWGNPLKKAELSRITDRRMIHWEYIRNNSKPLMMLSFSILFPWETTLVNTEKTFEKNWAHLKFYASIFKYMYRSWISPYLLNILQPLIKLLSFQWGRLRLMSSSHPFWLWTFTFVPQASENRLRECSPGENGYGSSKLSYFSYYL